MTARNRGARARSGVRRDGWLRRQLARRPLPLWVVTAADVLVLVLALLVYALFHHVLPRDEEAAGVVSRRAAAPVVAATQAPESMSGPEASAEPRAADPVGVFAQRFADKFTGGEIIADSEGYQSPSLNIRFQTVTEPELVYYVADIYMRDIECFRTVFAKDDFGRGRYEWLTDMSARLGGVMAVNGDYYGGRADGIVIRNGELYRKKAPIRDVCVIYWDGVMEIISPSEWNTESVMAKGAYQGWNFGPNLLDDGGNALSYFDSEVAGRNPRTAIGYFEPGHYCLVVVDGRSKKSRGATLEKLSEINGGRKCSDGIVIVDR